MRERARLSRRGFVGAAAGTAAATTLGPWAPAAGARGRHGHNGERLLPRDLIGVQLFTVRDRVTSHLPRFGEQDVTELRPLGGTHQHSSFGRLGQRSVDSIVVDTCHRA